jgi:fatty-acyl-CoA synthase
VVLERAGVGDAELLDHLRARLAPHAVPKRIHRVRSLPRTPAGKLLRRLL